MADVIACGVGDVLPWPCVCERNGWEHEWVEAFAAMQRNPLLHWCANCDCCIAEMEADNG